jgi:hypothetical protein
MSPPINFSLLILLLQISDIGPIYYTLLSRIFNNLNYLLFPYSQYYRKHALFLKKAGGNRVF